jgi:hypothetical protein
MSRVVGLVLSVCVAPYTTPWYINGLNDTNQSWQCLEENCYSASAYEMAVKSTDERSSERR